MHGPGSCSLPHRANVSNTGHDVVRGADVLDVHGDIEAARLERREDLGIGHLALTQRALTFLALAIHPILQVTILEQMSQSGDNRDGIGADDVIVRRIEIYAEIRPTNVVDQALDPFQVIDEHVRVAFDAEADPAVRGTPDHLAGEPDTVP